MQDYISIETIYLNMYFLISNLLINNNTVVNDGNSLLLNTMIRLIRKPGEKKIYIWTYFIYNYI